MTTLFSFAKKISYIYLLFPIFLFGLGWLNFFAQAVFLSVVVISCVQLWKSSELSEPIQLKRKDIGIALFLMFLWVFLSGIGGFTFQNWDHHSRNAVFKDLIDYPWPVRYSIDPQVASQFQAPQHVILSYYFGFWLPAAWIGKIAGAFAANVFLLVWSLLGIILAVFLTAQRIKQSLVKTTLLFVFFSGMDIVGVWLLQNIPGYTYPMMWPPIQHLEWWAGSFQYSSFTSALFWTYNQFIPAFLILALFLNTKSGLHNIFLVGVCSFFAPLPALGLVPFAVGNIVNDLVSLWRECSQGFFRAVLKYMGTFENLAGISIGIISVLFFSTNLSAQSRQVGVPEPFSLYVLFVLLEGFLLWLLLFPLYKREWTWYIAGVILVFAPFVHLGSSWDFMLRTSLPALYYLYIGYALFFTQVSRPKIQVVLCALVLILGAMTPLYEISRSVVRTDRYYGYLMFAGSERYFQNPPHTTQLFVPELDHIDTLTAEEWVSVSIPNSVGWDTKVGRLFPRPYGILWQTELITDETPQ